MKKGGEQSQRALTRLARDRLRKKAVTAKQTPEEQEQRLAKRRAAAAAALTPEEREQRLAKRRAAAAKQTPEEREKLGQ